MISIREATLSDIYQMHTVRCAVKENALSHPGRVTYNDYEEYLSKRGKGWVGLENNRVVGFAIADLVQHNVWALFVHPNDEKKGLGRQLQKTMLAWYFAQTRLPIWLSTSPNTRAAAFYRLSGWRCDGPTATGEIKFEMAFEDWLSHF